MRVATAAAAARQKRGKQKKTSLATDRPTDRVPSVYVEIDRRRVVGRGGEERRRRMRTGTVCFVIFFLFF